MACPLPVKKWWQEYVAGRLRTPQDIVSAARAEEPDEAQASDRFFDVPEPGPKFDAPKRLRARHFIRSENYMRQMVRADWSHVDHRLIVWSALFQAMARKRGIPLYVHCAFRSEAEQKRLLAEGRTKARYPRSAHNIGEAVDIVHGVYHWDMNREEWQYLSVLGSLALDRLNATLKKANKLSLSWGGDWRFYDPAHWEISDYRQRIRKLSQPESPLQMAPTRALALRDSLLAGL